MEKKKGSIDVIREKTVRDIVMKYLFIKTIEENYGDEYIKAMYKINPKLIRQIYSELEDDEKKEMEDRINKQIELGEVDLNKEAVNWHREGIKQKNISEENRKKSIGKEEH